ncbi:hypothetical protein SMSP2_01315 [Limihaloglobus sulfuriphilus]|uniref:LamG-like jellyroll fold domain-containing protein n=1 Tax=Limihaloglobus sulfuriphilus TaxID=1851148 RepID=A0A1Q2ME20_9BACT|nr:LamG domain-containing protein [Limihaloglobus sulfuriphilus]AQQ70951.1 hypothetical protein SMSP2_01315 [Limihaloglobus sulfuriphilus]
MKRLIFCLSLSLLLLTNAAFPFDAGQNLEVYYPFDQTQGTSVTDTVGPCSGTVTSLDGQALGTFWGAGKFSGGINLDGMTGVLLSNAHILGNFQNKTLSMWFCPDASTAGSDQNYFLWSNRNSGADEFKIYVLYRNNSIQFVAALDGGGSQTRIVPIDPPDGSTWHHVAVVMKDGAVSGTTDFDYYLDGSLVETTTGGVQHTDGSVNGPSIGANAVDAAPLNPPTNHQAFVGKIDEFRIYSAALIDTDIAGLYAHIPESSGPGEFNPELDMDIYYPFDQDSGEYAYDSMMTQDAQVRYLDGGSSSPWGANGVDGLFDFCAELDGTNAFLIPNASVLGNFQNKTISMWVCPSTDVFNVDRNYFIWSNRNSGADVFKIYLYYKASQLRCATETGEVRVDIPTPDGQTWHHIAVVIENTADDLCSMSLYIDGNLGGSTAGNARHTDGSINGPSIGATAADASIPVESYQGFLGKIDDFRIYGRPLQPVEVAALKDYIPQEAVIDITSSLDLYWKCDETSGIILSDSAGNDINNGVIVNAPSGDQSWWTGAYNGGIWLDGASCLILDDVNDTYSFGSDSTNNKTVSMWIRPDAIPSGDRFLFSVRPGGGMMYKVYIIVKSNGSVGLVYDYWREHIQEELPDGTIVDDYVMHPTSFFSAADAIAPDQWTHVAMTINQTSDNFRTFSLYLDGEMIHSAPGAEVETGNVFYGLTIGGHAGDVAVAHASFSGTLDEVRIYDRPMSAPEIQALYSYGPVLAGDVNGDAACGPADVSQMAGMWLNSSLSVAGTESLIEDGNFESYADQTALEGKWFEFPLALADFATESTVTLLTNPADAYTGSNALRWNYRDMDSNTGLSAFTEIVYILDNPIDLTSSDLVTAMINRHEGNSLEKALYIKFLSGTGTAQEFAADASNRIKGQMLIKRPNGSSAEPVGWDQWVIDLHDLQYRFGDAYSDLNDIGALLFGVWTPADDDNGDGVGVIDIDDIKIVSLPECTGDNPEDINGDCQIDLVDMSLFSADWLVSNTMPGITQ